MKHPPSFIRIIAVVAGSMIATAAANPVLYVVADPQALSAGDTAVLGRLNNLGHTVTLVDDNLSQTSDAVGKDLVIVSSTVTSGNVLAKYRNVTIPVISYESAIFDDMLMTTDVDTVTRGTVASQTDLFVTALNHPITLGIGTGVRTVTTAPETFTFGVPAPSADILATVAGDQTKATIFVYEPNDLLIDGTTPAAGRRIGFFLQDNTASVLNPTGAQLFDRAVSYAIAVPEPSSIVLLAMTGAGWVATRCRRRCSVAL
jgi:hypothetical protein